MADLIDYVELHINRRFGLLLRWDLRLEPINNPFGPNPLRRKESDEALNQLFRALADGTRRDILARSLAETPSVSELAARYDRSFAALQKHVAAERAGLIQERANGREQLVSTNRARLQRASELLDYFESVFGTSASRKQLPASGPAERENLRWRPSSHL